MVSAFAANPTRQHSWQYDYCQLRMPLFQIKSAYASRYAKNFTSLYAGRVFV